MLTTKSCQHKRVFQEGDMAGTTDTVSQKYMLWFIGPRIRVFTVTRVTLSSTVYCMANVALSSTAQFMQI